VNFVTSGSSWWQGRLARCTARPEELTALADRCELLSPDEQRLGFERALRTLGDVTLAPEGMPADGDSLWVSLLADSGAYESAVLALLPPTAVFSGGRLVDGRFVAQVVLPSGAGAHSREARSLAMAWLAALLRALAREMIEERPLH
jgi:hypothetical protein